MINRILLSFISLLLLPLLSAAGTITVHPGERIQDAINRAKPGDVVRVLAGTYREKGITIDKPLIFLGEGNPVLDGEKKFEILTIKSGHVIVEGFTIINSGYSSMNDLAAIRIHNSAHVSIRNNKLVNNFFGIYCQHASYSFIGNNEISSNGISELESGNGIHGWKSDNLVIANNTISGHRDGIYFEFVTETTIFGNNSQQNIRYGLHFMFSHNNIYVSNIFGRNGAGVAVMYSRHVTMLKNEFRENWGPAAYGILMKDISDSYAEHNLFFKNTAAIYMEGSSRIMISRNTFSQNGYAIQLQASCDNNEIRQNNFSANSFDIATNGSVVLNSFSGNYWDKYEGYDLNKNGTGDIPYRPLSIFAMIVERNASAMMLFRSPVVSLIEKAERILPGITPENLKDDTPSMKPLPL